MDPNKEYSNDHQWSSGYSNTAVALLSGGNSVTVDSSDHAAGSIMGLVPQQLDQSSLQGFDGNRLVQISGLDDRHSSWQQSSVLASRSERCYDDQIHYNFVLGKTSHPQSLHQLPFLGIHGSSPGQSVYGGTGATRQLHGAEKLDQTIQKSLSQAATASNSKPAKARSHTKVLKLGSIGRSLNIARFGSYAELRSELARMFELDQSAGWQLVYMDKDGSILLVGDDRWEEFVTSVRGIRIMSPSEVAIYTSEEYAGTPLSTCLTRALMP